MESWLMKSQRKQALVDINLPKQHGKPPTGSNEQGPPLHLWEAFLTLLTSPRLAASPKMIRSQEVQSIQH